MGTSLSCKDQNALLNSGQYKEGFVERIYKNLLETKGREV